jgi:hypothetical protein
LQRRGKHGSATIELLFDKHVPGATVTHATGGTRVNAEELSWRQRLLNTQKALCMLQLEWYLECVLQTDCYNYCVKIGYQETAGEGSAFVGVVVTVIFKCVVQSDYCTDCFWWCSLGGQWIRYPVRNPVYRHSNTCQCLKHLCFWGTFIEILLIH